MAKKKRHSKYGKIHQCLDALGWDEERYRDTLFGMFGVTSKTMLSLEQLDEYIGMLRLEMVEQGALDPTDVRWGWGSRKYENLRDRRQGYANPAQLRKVEATWRDVARDTSDAALQQFIKRMAGVDHVIWLKKGDVEPVLIALKEMALKQNVSLPTGDQATVNRRSNSGQASSKSGQERKLAQMTQCERLLWWLRHKGEITPLEAQQHLSIGRLAARVYDLRRDGYDIVTHEREVTSQMGGTSTVAAYELA